MRNISKIIFSALSAMLCVPLSVSADEGMWMPFSLPDAVYQQMCAYGCKLPYQALNPDCGDSVCNERAKWVGASVVNFSGYCTGEVVSPMGLVMTNHHCGFEAVRSHSTVEHDYMLNGFVADSLAAELPNEDMYVAFMISQEDVTNRLAEMACDGKLDEYDYELLIDSLQDILTDEARKIDTTYYVEIDPFYERNAYYATTYQQYRDVRLVFAPPKSMGKFGGETDNWMWPRQTCDFSVFRIYVDPETGGPAEYNERNVPYGTVENHKDLTYMQVSTDGYNDGDFTMIMGYPGSTERYLSSYGIEQMRNCVNDPMQQVRGVKQAVMKRHMSASEEVRIKYDSKYAQSSNYWKNAIGMNKCIDSIGIVQLKREFEQRLTNWIDTVNTDTFVIEEDWEKGLSLPKLASYYAHRSEAMRAYTLFAETFTRRSNNELAIRASKYSNGMPVKGPKNKPKKQYVEFEDNSDSWDRDLDVEAMAALLANYRSQVKNEEYLPSFYEKIDKEFDGDYTRYVNAIWDNSVLMQSSRKIPMVLPKKMQKDIGIEFSMALVETMADIRLVIDSLKDSIQEQERMLCAAKMRMEQELPHYSDANFTMRLTYGQIGGYKLAGNDSGYFTTSQSIIDKMNLYEQHKDDNPNPYEEYYAEPVFRDLFDLYALRAEKETGKSSEALTPSQKCAGSPGALCFLSNTDITGGNSGSPVIDAHGRLIGLAFDGNWDSLSSDIYYDATLARTISVDIRYVLFMIKHWGHADRLLHEMGVEM